MKTSVVAADRAGLFRYQVGDDLRATKTTKKEVANLAAALLAWSSVVSQQVLPSTLRRLSMPENKKQHTWELLVAVSVLGFTMGLYTGWSSSPVVGSLITGVFGLLSGGVLAMFAFKTDKADGDAKPPVNGTALRGISLALTLVCLASVVGTVFGINVRNSNLALFVGKQDKLTPLASSSPDLPPALIAKLVILQRSLDNFGYSRRENNALLDQIKQACKRELPSAEETMKIRDDYRYLADLHQLIMANQTFFQKLPNNGWSKAQLHSSIGGSGAPSDLVRLAANVKISPSVMDDHLKKLQNYPYDRGTQEKRLDFLFENKLIGTAVPKMIEPPPGSPAGGEGVGVGD
jgi:hypothetical protein